ncbi:MAG: lysylphosphatidylglycerol synthase transmembrane domain-containing protein [Sciscionella sp.]
MSEHVAPDQLTPPAKGPVEGPVEGNTAEVAERTPTWRSYALAWLRRILLLLVVLGAGYTLVRNWETVARTLGRLPWEETVLSQLAVIVGIGLGTIGWSAVVDGLGPRVGIMRGAQINLVGQLGKYVPGSVWAYLLQMELGRRAGIARARVFTGSLIQAGVGLVTALVFAVAALPMLTTKFPATIYLVAVLPFALAMLHPRVLTFVVNRVLRVLRRAPLEHRLRYRLIGRVFGLQVLAYGFFGLHLWLLARAVGAAPGALGLLLCAAAISIGLNAGMFVFVLPSGVGVRDGVIVAVLISALPYSPALAFAVVSRVMFLVADVLTAGAAAGLARWRRPLGII